MEEAVEVVALGSVLGLGLEHDLESESVPDREPGWEFDQEPLQVPGQEPARAFDQDTELDRCQVGLGPQGHDQVSALHRSHQGSGCTVSGILLLCDKHEEFGSAVRDLSRKILKAI